MDPCGTPLRISVHELAYFDSDEDLLSIREVTCHQVYSPAIQTIGRQLIKKEYHVAGSQMPYKIIFIYFRIFETNNISSVELLLRHNNIFLTDTYLPCSIFLAQPLLCERQQGSC